jgi:predicted DNA-binding protein (MmcQ/YjbR family)
MDFDLFKSYCLKKKGVTQELPFNDFTPVFKVAGKVFAITHVVNEPQSFTLKCDPEYAIELREKYDAIQPGYHQNKKHWNSVILDGTLSDKFIFELTDQSYQLVVDGMSSKEKELLEKM